MAWDHGLDPDLPWLDEYSLNEKPKQALLVGGREAGHPLRGEARKGCYAWMDQGRV